MENKLPTVDYSKLNFRIGIDVCENGSIFYVFDVVDGYEVNHYTVIGVIESLKAQWISLQKESNIKSPTVQTQDELQKSQQDFETSRRKYIYPNDMSVKDSLLNTRIKNAIKRMTSKAEEYDIWFGSDDRWFGEKEYKDVMLSDLRKFTVRQWSRVKNVGRMAIEEMNNYLDSLGI